MQPNRPIFYASDGLPAKPLRKITLQEVSSTFRSAAWFYYHRENPTMETFYKDAIKRLQKKQMKMSEIRQLFENYYEALVADGRREAASNLALRMRRL